MPWIYNASPELDHISQYRQILATCLSLTLIAAMVVGLRFYCRAVIVHKLGADDFVILASVCCSIIYNAMCIEQTRWGLGLPLALRPPVNLLKYTAVNFAARSFYMLGITGFKAALCIVYLRIVDQSHDTYRRTIWVVMISCILAHFGGILVLLFQCQPVWKSWYPETHGKCLNNAVTFYVLAAITIFYDLLIIALPIPLLLRLQISTRKKIGLIGVFACGLFTTVSSIMRMVQINVIAVNGNSTMLILWGTIEMNVGISTTCLPTLTPLFKSCVHRAKTAYSNSSRSRQGSGQDGEAKEPSVGSYALRSIGGTPGYVHGLARGHGVESRAERGQSTESVERMLGLPSESSDSTYDLQQKEVIRVKTDVDVAVAYENKER